MLILVLLDARHVYDRLLVVRHQEILDAAALDIEALADGLKLGSPLIFWLGERSGMHFFFWWFAALALLKLLPPK